MVYNDVKHNKDFVVFNLAFLKFESYMKHTNKLIHATSPYLLQHAHNPVNWLQWDEGIFVEAKKEDKLVLISIGYAACHWCHVMEHESFEDTGVAFLMNKDFICIKVDREERPDVDHYYMSAVQLMQQQGGWPLNVVALPDGRPIWGGTYFPKETWMKNLVAIADFYKKNKSKTEEYAAQLQNGIEQVSLMPKVENVIPVNSKILERGVEEWKNYFDMEEGGRTGAPKFPMPVNLDFLLYYAWQKQDDATLNYVCVTLEKMARGGIYDQVGGGFARYSVDDKWKVPHFEKMLYDNGQLLSIYSKAWQHFGNHEFQTVVYETTAFIERELMDVAGAFYSSLDADSEGEEGKFYVWKKKELQTLLGDEFDLFADYYNVNSKGFWEQGNYILLRDDSDKHFALNTNLTEHELTTKVGRWKYLLLKEREKRTRPGLDDKTLTSWNAIVIQGLVDAFKVFNDEYFLRLATKNAEFLLSSQLEKDGKLFHSWKAGTSSINGFLEDYSLMIQALLSLYEVSGNEYWLDHSELLAVYCFDHFYNKNIGLFYFSEFDSESVISNHFQKEDNVIPAANSVMANNLHRLYLLQGNPEYLTVVKKMLQYITPHFTKYPMAYANWGVVMLKLVEPYYEVAVCGINSRMLVKQLNKNFQPNVLWAFAEQESETVLLKNRFVKNDDLIYVCKDGVCKLPVKTVEEAFELINKK